MMLSVIVPTYGRPQLLRHGLEALAAQTLPRQQFEVLVVDDGSPEPPQEVVERLGDDLDLSLLTKSHGGLAAARNYGAARATGDILLFMDDDIVPCPEFLAAHLEVHRREERAVALGSLPHPDDLPLTPFLYYLDRVSHYDLFLRYGRAENIPLPPLNGNASVRRVHFEGAGGYDLDFSGYGGEDTELGYRLLRAGLAFRYVPQARGFHYHRKDFAAYERDMYSTGITMVMMVRKHPEVLARVNLDIVSGELGTVPFRKRAQRFLFLLLSRASWLITAVERVIASTERFGLRRALYPLFLLVGHYHYGRGMRDEIARGRLQPGSPST